MVLMMATLPFKSPVEGIGKIELYDHWFVGPVFRAHGMIWVHRGQPDRRALRAALDALAEGRIVTLAPEGRQSVIGGLEEGNPGAAFLARKSGAPLVPIGLTGTENKHVYDHLTRWKRVPVTLSVGKPFFLQEYADRQTTLREGTQQIMESLASQLPESYRGQYKSNP
jgi:1-acyl-sn-glycerol-3-phosphate acyltransferase